MVTFSHSGNTSFISYLIVGVTQMAAGIALSVALAGSLTAVGVVGGTLSIPVGFTRCCPTQSVVNVVAGVFLGPWYSLGMAFCVSLIRNLLGTGTIMAFPGSMCGALLAGSTQHGKYSKARQQLSAGGLHGL